MRWPSYGIISVAVTLLALSLGVAQLNALPPGAEQVAAVRRLVAALQEDLRVLVLEHLEALAFDHEILEDHLELLSEAVQDLVEQGGVYRPDQVRVLLNQAEEILEAFLWQLEQALAMLADIEAQLVDLQNQLDALKNDRLLLERAHQKATRALQLAQQILLGKLLPPLDNLQALSDDGILEDCVTDPFGEPNPAADLRDCFNDAGAALTDRDYEMMLDQVEAARSKLEPMLSRLVQVFRGTNWRRGPVSELLVQLKSIDRQLVAAFKRLLRRPRLSDTPPRAVAVLDNASSYNPPTIIMQLTIFDLQGRLLLQLSDGRALSSRAASLANGVYLLILTEQRPDGRLRRVLHKIVVRH